MIIGFLLGFWGYVMIGTINLAVLELAKNGTRASLIRFIAVLLVCEFIYCFSSLYFLNYLTAYPQIITGAKYTAIILLVLLGLWALLEKPGDVVIERRNIVARGYWSAIVHPQQIPFWLLWGVYLIEKDIVRPSIPHLALFALSNAFGALCMLFCYALWGNKLISVIRLNLRVIKIFVGILCLATAVYMIYDVCQD